MKRPNFFIVGAPKSGTTALSVYLREHDKIFFTTPKEPCFFSQDFPGQREVTTEQEYLDLYSQATEEHIAVGEGSVWYLYSEVAIENLHKFNSEAKIIVMLRNPVEQVYSMHQELYARRYETESDFQKAWSMQAERKQGKHIPKYCREAAFLQYEAIPRYSSQIERLFKFFPREQIKIILFQDFIKNTRSTYVDVLDFLGVPDDGRERFPRVLESRRYKYHWIGSFLMNPPKSVVKTKDFIKRVLGIKKFGVKDLSDRHNTVVEKRQPLPEDFIIQLKQLYQDDVLKLSRLLDTDLSFWCE